MPLGGVGFDVGAVKLLPLVVSDGINTEVVLQWIPAGDVVIVVVFDAPDGATALVYLSRVGFDFHLNFAVAKTDAVCPAQVERAAVKLLDFRQCQYLVG